MPGIGWEQPHVPALLDWPGMSPVMPLKAIVPCKENVHRIINSTIIQCGLQCKLHQMERPRSGLTQG